MARKATFAVKTPKSNSSAHNSREEIPKYLIDHSGKSGNTYRKITPYVNDEQFKDLAKDIYNKKFVERTGQNQKMQRKQVEALIKEVVISVEAYHTESDIFSLFEMLKDEKKRKNEQDKESKKPNTNNETGYHILEIACHRDEGHFVRKMYGGELAYYPSINILYKNDGKWYIKEDEFDESTDEDAFTLLAPMEEFEVVYNYHFHVKFTNFNVETGLTARFAKGEISGEGRLKKVANFLGLEYVPEEKISIEQPVKSVKEQYRKSRKNMIQQMKKQYEQDMVTTSHFQVMAEESDQALVQKDKEQEEVCMILGITMPDGYDHAIMMDYLTRLIDQTKNNQALIQKQQDTMEKLRTQNMQIFEDLQIKNERINELEKSVLSHKNRIELFGDENHGLRQELANEKEFRSQFELEIEKGVTKIYELNQELTRMKDLELNMQIDMGRIHEAEKSSDSAWELAGEHLKKNKLLKNALDYLVKYGEALSQDERREIADRILSGESVDEIGVLKENISIPTPPKKHKPTRFRP